MESSSSSEEGKRSISNKKSVRSQNVSQFEGGNFILKNDETKNFDKRKRSSIAVESKQSWKPKKKESSNLLTTGVTCVKI